MCDARPSGHNITSFEFYLQNTSGSAVMAGTLYVAVISLPRVSPSIKPLCFSRRPSHNLLQKIGEAHPLPISFTVSRACKNNHPYLGNMLQLQSTLLPHIIIPAFTDQTGGFELPIAFENLRIEIVDLHACYFTTGAHWLAVPCNLWALQRRTIDSEPPPTVDRSSLVSWLGSRPVNLSARICRPYPPLQQLQILQLPHHNWSTPHHPITNISPLMKSSCNMPQQLLKLLPLLSSPFLNIARDGASLLSDAISFRMDHEQSLAQEVMDPSISATNGYISCLFGALRCSLPVVFAWDLGSDMYNKRDKNQLHKDLEQ